MSCKYIITPDRKKIKQPPKVFSIRHLWCFIQPQSYDEVLTDLVPMNLADYETLMFDTGGKLINLIGLWAIKQDPKNAKRDGSLSLQGYGTVGKEFVRLMDYCFYELDKHIVVLFHAIEEKDGDTTRLRLMVEGQTRNNVWIPMDLGGFMEMYGNNRTLGLSNCERYYAKGTRGINGILKIPELTEKSPNNYLATLFAQFNEKAAKEIEDTKAQSEAYTAAVEEGMKIIESIVDAESATAAMPMIKAISHSLTSEIEVNTTFKKKLKDLGLFYDNVLKKFTPAPPEDAPTPQVEGADDSNETGETEATQKKSKAKTKAPTATKGKAGSSKGAK